MKRRILLIYITKVSGHRQATLAIQQSLRHLDPDAEIPCINGFGYTYPRLEKVINKAYMGVIKRTPLVWDYLYDNPKVVKNSQTIKNFLHKTSYKKLGRLFERYQPDTVVCTQAFPCGMVADFKKAYHLDIMLMGVLTDYLPHSYWINEGVDYYIVPCEEAKERFISLGVSSECIQVLGIPIRTKFALTLDKEALAREYGLDRSVPVIMIMGGGQGLGPIKEVVKSLLHLERPLQIMVIAGTNKKLIRWLRRRVVATHKKLLIFEYVKNVDELMELATLIITKPGGMTTSEALAKGLPMVIVDPIPGQETRNCEFLLKKGIAVYVEKEKDIGREVESLMNVPERLKVLREAALRHGKPRAALDIAQLILNTSRSPMSVS